MKATLLRFWCTCMCMLFCLAAQAAEPDELNKKEYEKSFPANKSDELFISNKYGGITITHWDKAEVAFRVVNITSVCLRGFPVSWSSITEIS